MCGFKTGKYGWRPGQSITVLHISGDNFCFSSKTLKNNHETMANRFPDPQPLPWQSVEILLDENNNQQAVAVVDNPLPVESESESDDGDVPDDEFVSWDMAQVTGEFHLAWEHYVRRHLAREAREAREAQQAQEGHYANAEGGAGHNLNLTDGGHGDTDDEHGQDGHDVGTEGHHEGDDGGDISASDDDDEVEVKGEPSKHQVCKN